MSTTTLQIDRYLEEHVRANRSLEKLALRLFRRGGSSRSASVYVDDIVGFCRWLKESPDQAIFSSARDPKAWGSLINDYLDDCESRGLAKGTSVRKARSVFKWLEVNEVEFAKAKVELPRIIKTESDQIPTKQILRKVIAAGNNMNKVVALLALSSGLRLSSLISLRLKDVKLDREIPVFTPPQESTKGKVNFLTFCTPETKEAISLYLKERESRGEVLTPESRLVVCERPRGRPMTSSGVWWLWNNMLELAGSNQSTHKWKLFHFHVLRKYYKSWASLSGMNAEIVEFTMGHRSSIAQLYFIPDARNAPEEVLQRLEQEYRKAVGALTIFSEDEKIAELEEKVTEKAKELEANKADYEKKLDELKARMDAMELELVKKKQRMVR